jgi:hypothetical protein
MARFVLKERGSYVDWCAACGRLPKTLIVVKDSNYIERNYSDDELPTPVICADCILQMHAILKVESEDYGTI